MWLNIHPLSLSVCVPFKNGTTSMGKAIRTYLQLPEDKRIRRWKVADYTDKLDRTDAPQYPTAVLIVRHPEERFMSLWKNKCRDRMSGGFGIEGLTPEGLITAIQLQRDNHWVPQDEFRDGARCQKATIEVFARFWEEYTGQKFPHLYASEGSIGLSEETRNQLRVIYAKDYELWEDRQDDIWIHRRELET
jgi:hypothetical protein